MPSGTCSRRMGFADTVTPLASLIVLGARLPEGPLRTRSANAETGLRTPSAGVERLARQSTLLDAVMPWQWSGPAFHDGMPGQPIWSLQCRRQSASRLPASSRPKEAGAVLQELA